jgi:hypothetical protein
MANTKCPWCEVEVVLELDDQSSSQTCAECLSTWTYIEIEISERELALAA